MIVIKQKLLVLQLTNNKSLVISTVNAIKLFWGDIYFINTTKTTQI